MRRLWIPYRCSGLIPITGLIMKRPTPLRTVRECVIEILREGLDPRLLYHNLDHTLAVARNVRQLARFEGLEPIERRLLETAALFHDTGLISTYEDHESASVAIARQWLPRLDYPDEHIDRICELILATRPLRPPRNKIEGILCDADLDYLGTRQYFTISDRLRQELASFGQPMPDRDWLLFQLEFIQAHRYFSPAALRLRDPIKQQNLATLQQRLKDLNGR